MLTEKQVLLLVNGIGGIGKTTLAARYYHRYAAEYAHLIWAAVNSDIAAAFAEIAAALDLQFPATSTVAERTAQTVLALTELNQPCLLVLDNANNPQDLAANYHDALRKLSCLHVLVTTRVPDLSCAETLKIGHLEPNAALKLFKAFYPQHRAEDDALLVDILAAVDFHTLTIEIMAKSIAERNRLRQHCSLAALRQMLLDKGVLQLHLSAAVQTDYQHLQKAQPEAIIASMYNLAELPDTEKKLLSLFSVLPAKNIPFTHIEDLLPKFTELETAADGLARKGWVEFEQRSGQFKISPVVQEIVRKENAARLANDAKELLQSLVAKLAYQTGTGILTEIKDHQLALDYVQYGESLCHYLLATSDAFLLGFLLDRLGQFFITFGNLPKALSFFEKDAKLCQVLHEAHPEYVGFKNGLAILYEKLGETHSSLGHLQEALSFFEKYAKLCQELHERHSEYIDFKNGLAISYEKLGETHSRLGHLQEALAFFEKETTLFEELHDAHPEHIDFKNGLANSYSKLGETHCTLDHQQEALSFFEKFAKLMQELHEAHPEHIGFKNGLAISYSKLGETHRSLDHQQKALSFFEKFDKLMQELHEAYPEHIGFKNGLAVSYSKLGDTHISLGHLQEAIFFFEKFSELSQELHKEHPEHIGFKNGLAVSYAKLAVFAKNQKNDIETARNYFFAAQNIWQKLVVQAPDYAEFQRNLQNVNKMLAELKSATTGQ